MRRQHEIPVVFLAISIAMPAVAALAGDANQLSHIESAAHFVNKTIADGYRAAPALMLVFAMLLAIPLMAFASRFWVWTKTPRELSPRARRKLAERENVAAAIAGDASHLPGHAYLEVVGASGARFTILRDMLRIGREDDNDIRIPSNTVDGYHAAIRREDLGEYRIVDLSGHAGRGVFVNGARCTEALLHDGDMIELGPGRLRFHAGLL